MKIDFIANCDLGDFTVTSCAPIDPELEAEAVDQLERLDRNACKLLEELKTTDRPQYLSHLAKLIEAVQADKLDELRAKQVAHRIRLAPARKKALASLLKARGVKTAAGLKRS
jgi:hypothetical protein